MDQDSKEAMERKEYRDLLIKYYSENGSFIEKSIFAVTSAAISFLLGLTYNVPSNYMLFYCISIILFIITLIIQLYSAYVGKEACDLALDDTTQDEGFKLFDKTRSLNIVFYCFFCAAIIYTAITIPYITVQNTPKQQAVEEKQIPMQIQNNYTYIEKVIL